MKRLIKKSGKQVGLLYHYTGLEVVLKILRSNKLDAHEGYISFTRNQFFEQQSRKIGVDEIEARLTIDGDSLSNNYKISPYHDKGWFDSGSYRKKYGPFKSQDFESEERVKGNIESAVQYIREITIYRSKVEDEDTVFEWKYIDDYYRDLGKIDKTLDGDKDTYTPEDVAQYIIDRYDIPVTMA